ncbi:uncharacterized protein K489DRAFT_193183 [Dissoconium aciculare CBS 342.82]|uniref:Uncharacterized protein n=1 Tax=Dissoconium aciculare CBS 342.82 TaxID=1314786 RepID=A0A6J3M5J7_9PEZI|nr:uncharacterized protein K489DRAFT_193183 [Dissoconium aciculare CBS 342.82]KAF1823336.1 hypothetical protein K489DRAFT_193183 [Dissoconium aciculare CBS 342.82]
MCTKRYVPLSGVRNNTYAQRGGISYCSRLRTLELIVVLGAFQGCLHRPTIDEEYIIDEDMAEIRSESHQISLPFSWLDLTSPPARLSPFLISYVDRTLHTMHDRWSKNPSIARKDKMEPCDDDHRRIADDLESQGQGPLDNSVVPTSGLRSHNDEW